MMSAVSTIFQYHCNMVGGMPTLCIWATGGSCLTVLPSIRSKHVLGCHDILALGDSLEADLFSTILRKSQVLGQPMIFCTLQARSAHA